MEEWRTIEGYEGKYQVSNLGKVKSLKDRYGNPREKILHQGKNSNGYLLVVLYKEGKLKHYLVHRLVANAFIPNPNNYPYVNHKDENPSNNCVDNLEWCDAKYNINYGTCINRRVSSTDYKAIADKKSKKVFQYDKQGNLIKIWASTRECGRNGFAHNHVSDCCRGKLKTYRGFKWSYEEINPK